MSRTLTAISLAFPRRHRKRRCSLERNLGITWLAAMWFPPKDARASWEALEKENVPVHDKEFITNRILRQDFQSIYKNQFLLA